MQVNELDISATVSFAINVSLFHQQDELSGTNIKGPVTTFTLHHKAGDSDFSTVSIASSPLKANVPSPQLGVAYTVAVSATNVGGESERSDEKTVSK